MIARFVLTFRMEISDGDGLAKAAASSIAAALSDPNELNTMLRDSGTIQGDEEKLLADELKCRWEDLPWQLR